jgi:hypothetical protein
MEIRVRKELSRLRDAAEFALPRILEDLALELGCRSKIHEQGDLTACRAQVVEQPGLVLLEERARSLDINQHRISRTTPRPAFLEASASAEA